MWVEFEEEEEEEEEEESYVILSYPRQDDPTGQFAWLESNLETAKNEEKKVGYFLKCMTMTTYKAIFS